MITNWFGDNEVKQSSKSNSRVSRYRIGDRVRNGRFGAGQVRGFRPDGSAIVRFDGRKNSQVIFPSLLEK